MSYTITNTRGQVITIIANEIADTTTTLTLLGRNFAGYGTIIADDFIKLLENSASDTVYPSTPIEGELCYRIDAQTLFLWNGTTSTWQMVGMKGGDTFPNLVYFDGGFIVRNILAPTNCKMRRIRIDNSGAFLIEGLNDDFSVKVIPLTISCDGFMHAAATPAPTDDSTTLATTAFVKNQIRNLQSTLDGLQAQITALANALAADVTALQAVDTSLQNQITALNNNMAYVAARIVTYGIITMWAGDGNNVPVGWHICDGSIGYNANGTIAWWTPNLSDRFIIAASPPGGSGRYPPHSAAGAESVNATAADGGAGTYSIAGGNHSHGLSDAGSHSHGGAVAGHTLSNEEMPWHDHNLKTDRAIIYYAPSNFNNYMQYGPVVPVYTQFDDTKPKSEGSSWSHDHGINADGGHNHAVDAGNANPGYHTHSLTTVGHTHAVNGISTMSPYYALCFIMRIT